MTTKFTKRLNDAVEIAIGKMKLNSVNSRRLYTPIWRDKGYRWVTPMDSDGLLVAEREIKDGGGDRKLRLGVIIQSEFSTSNTRPNPLGKALVGKIPLGVWVDLVNGSSIERVRLDVVTVLFLLPQPTHHNKKAVAATAAKHVADAAEASDDADILEVAQGAKAADIADAIVKKTRGWLKGSGRPAV